LAGSICRTSRSTVDIRQIDDRHGELLADRLQHLRRGDEAQPDEHVVQPLAGAVLLGDRLGELLVADQAALDKDAANAHENHCNDGLWYGSADSPSSGGSRRVGMS
jgi:hypothetical protein